MPTTDELHEADKKHEAAIAELRAGLEKQGVVLSRHDEHLSRLDEFMTELRDTLSTKEDIAALRTDLRQRDELTDDRLRHYRDRLMVLEGDDDERKADEKHAEGMQINWAMVALFVGELMLGGMQLLWMVRHG